MIFAILYRCPHFDQISVRIIKVYAFLSLAMDIVCIHSNIQPFHAPDCIFLPDTFFRNDFAVKSSLRHRCPDTRKPIFPMLLIALYVFPWHQYHRLNMARENDTANSYPSLVKGNMSTDRCLFVKPRPGTYQRFACSSGTCQPVLEGCQFTGTYLQTGI